MNTFARHCKESARCEDELLKMYYEELVKYLNSLNGAPRVFWM